METSSSEGKYETLKLFKPKNYFFSNTTKRVENANSVRENVFEVFVTQRIPLNLQQTPT